MPSNWLARCRRTGGEIVSADSGNVSRDFATTVHALDALVRPACRDEPGHGPHLAPIRQRIESVLWTLTDPARA